MAKVQGLNTRKKILFITLSNLGDCVMSLPAFDFLRREFPDGRITVVTSERSRVVFVNHPEVDELVVFDKRAALKEKIKLFFQLQRQGFDIIVDLKNTFYRWGLKAEYKNPAIVRFPSWCCHDSQRHLYKAIIAVKGFKPDEELFNEYNIRRNPCFISAADKEYIGQILSEKGLFKNEEFILLVPGAKSELKRWDKKGFVEVGKQIIEKYGYKIVVVGDPSERKLVEEVASGIGLGAIALSGKTNFNQLSALVECAKIVVGNDSGVLQIASYMDKLVVGIYGPSNYVQYGPWSKRGFVVRKNILCAPCGSAHCVKNKECIETITPYDVLLGVRLILEGDESRLKEAKYGRILIVRTDRIGDVLLSTPVIKVLREHYPSSFIAMMVAPNTKDIVDGNPYLDKFIVFDKDRSAGLFATLRFAKRLKKDRFDIAIVLHPTVRVHLLLFLAGIKERLGFDRKAPYFLTKAIPHLKQQGTKHEIDYNFDLLKPLGIDAGSRQLYMPIRESSERMVEQILQDAGVEKDDVLVAINPAASCVSKLWPLAKFAELIDRLYSIPKIKVLIVADELHRSLSMELLSLTKSMPLDFSGRFDLSGLASLFKRVKLVISNDSGPVHLSVAVGTPVISIFGRNQPGLSPRRWGPVGPKDVILHKKTDCKPCLAHECINQFSCLESVSVQEVLFAAKHILNNK